MKQETFDKAIELKHRIERLRKLIELLNEGSANYELDPPTRQSGFSLYYRDNYEACLSEAEVLLIRDALMGEQTRLIDEFRAL